MSDNQDNFNLAEVPFTISNKPVIFTDDSFYSQCDCDHNLFTQEFVYLPELTEADRIMRKLFDEYVASH